jgi:hypothetical protein
MRNAGNCLPIDTLFVLGAGASFAATEKGEYSSPLDRDFCDALLRASIRRPSWYAESIKSLQSQWKDYVGLRSYGLEQAIIRQLGHIEYAEAIYARRRRGAPTALEFLNNVAHVVAARLRRAREHSSRPYGNLWKHARTHLTEQRNIRFITFNYDTLLDRHVPSDRPAAEVYFDRLQQSRTAAEPTTKYSEPLILKLHGSINWRVDQSSFKRILDDAKADTEYISPIWLDDKEIPSPSDRECPCIIPPLPAKPISKYKLFLYLWTRAAEYLQTAKHIVICGYSLPDADRMAISLFGSFRNSRLNRITVVDPSAATLERWTTVLGRQHIPKHVQWDWQRDFREYVNRL